MIRITQLTAVDNNRLEGKTGDGRRVRIDQRGGQLLITVGVQDSEMRRDEGNVLRLKVTGPLSFEEIVGYCRGLVRFF